MPGGRLAQKWHRCHWTQEIARALLSGLEGFGHVIVSQSRSPFLTSFT